MDGKDGMKILMMMRAAGVPNLEAAVTLSSTWSSIGNEEVDEILKDEQSVLFREDAMK